MKRLLFLLAWCVFGCTLLPLRANAAPPGSAGGRPQGATLEHAGTAAPAELLALRADGHLLGFTRTSVYLAGTDHLLTERFVGTAGVLPVSAGGAQEERESGLPAELESVTYRDLWPGISVRYDATSRGMVESTYLLEPFADVEQVRLRHNVPVTIGDDGGLRFTMPSRRGHFGTTAPVAWQEMDGCRAPVDVAFIRYDDGTVGFGLGAYDASYAVTIDPIYQWHTFLGSEFADLGQGIAVDGAGDVYVVGSSDASWGSPLHAHSGGSDIVVMKLSSDGALLWHTFYGSSSSDNGNGIAVDADENVYVVGKSYEAWGAPIDPHGGPSYDDIAVLKLDPSGGLLWHTFHGSWHTDMGNAITLDAAGNVYVTGMSMAAWGNPVAPFEDFGTHIDVIKLNLAGALQWHTFAGCGSGCSDVGLAITVDASQNVYVVGQSHTPWGTPVNPHSGWIDIVALKLDSAGARQWHTFLGSATDDEGRGVAVDGDGNVYVVGATLNSWGSPLAAHNGENQWDVTVAKLSNAGALQWHTFLGSTGFDLATDAAIDSAGGLIVLATSQGTWGAPDNPYSDGRDVALARVDESGAVTWNSFFGSAAGDENANGLALDGAGNMLVVATGAADWGSPIDPINAGTEIVVMKVSGESAPGDRNLVVTKAGTGDGTVASSPSGIACGSSCSASFAEGTSITLTATPSVGSQFTGWSNGSGPATTCVGNGPCSFALTANGAVTATFEPEGTGTGGGSAGGGGSSGVGNNGGYSSGGDSDDDGCGIGPGGRPVGTGWLLGALLAGGAVARATSRRHTARLRAATGQNIARPD